MKIVFIGLTISSSWGNGHATTYRSLLDELGEMGHIVNFLEHDKPWYKNTRDFDHADSYQLDFYASVEELKNHYLELVQEADMVVLGSYVPEGIVVAHWILENAKGITAFYDIDTPLTLQNLEEGEVEYISKSLIPDFDLYLSFAGGEVLKLLENTYGAKNAKPLYCSVDPKWYYPENIEKKWLLGYLGTYSEDRQPALKELLLAAARRLPHENFVVGGPGYPNFEQWPSNVLWMKHLPPHHHREFYCSQRFTLNVTRKAMKNLGYSPSVRLFEAAACGVPIISDNWKGLSDLFEEQKEIFISNSTEETLEILNNTSPEKLREVGEAARQKVLASHTATHRALELISYYMEIKSAKKTNKEKASFKGINGH
jgi:spore maturation protein CgeB